MNKISRELLKIAREVKALDEEGDEQKEMLDRAQKEGKKYILRPGRTGLKRIQACKNFGDVKKGDFGGLIQKEESLSHKGNCWVYDNARVWAEAQVYDNAKVYDKAQVFDGAKVYGNAKVYGRAYVYDEAQVYDNAQVFGNAKVFDYAKIHGKAKVDYNVENQEITK